MMLHISRSPLVDQRWIFGEVALSGSHFSRNVVFIDGLFLEKHVETALILRQRVASNSGKGKQITVQFLID